MMINEDFESTGLRIAVLASGSGTTLQAVIDACEKGLLDGQVVVVISNNSASGAITRAARHQIPFVHLSSQTHNEPESLDREIAEALKQHAPDVVLLAGYMKKLGPHTLEAYRGRVINTHPSLLPKFGGQGMYGKNVHAAVIESGDQTTGISVHLVDGDYDTGRVLAQREIAVEHGDDAEALAGRVQAIERPFLIKVLKRIAAGELKLSGT
jgi:phosphoribosylglycinamide formyltransferase-1